MVTVPSPYRLPTAEELPHSDETPVDNQLQNDVPNLLLSLLALIWGDRDDWFFGVDMALHYDPAKPAIVPDGFLAVGVKRNTGERGRLSYVAWSESVLPILALEVISEKYNDEYASKLENYQAIGILYYAVYNPLSGRRGQHRDRDRLVIYQLVHGTYQPIPNQNNQGNQNTSIWLPELGLGLGYARGSHLGWEREWLYWYDAAGNRYLTAEERATQATAIANQERLAKQQAQQIANQERLAKQQAQMAQQAAEQIAHQERQQKEKLAAYLRALGVNPEDL